MMPGPTHQEKCKKNEQKHLAALGLASALQNIWGLCRFAVKHFVGCQSKERSQYDPDYPTKPTA